MRAYISGPITGNAKYKELFDDCESKLINEGYDVVNPTKVDIKCLSWEEFIYIDLYLIKSCDAVVMLPGWEKSKGACIEYGYALGLSKNIIFN